MKARYIAPVILVLGLVAAGIGQQFLFPNETVLDAKNKPTLPANFRKVPDLKILGSAQFSTAQLKHVIHSIHALLMIIDLRKETHAFINGNAVSWMAGRSHYLFPVVLPSTTFKKLLQEDKTMGLVSVYEVALNHQQNVLEKSPKESLGAFHNIAKLPLPIVTIGSENQIVSHLHIPYVHYLVDYLNIPTPTTVDHFVLLFKNLPSNTWLYFHCQDGIQRTNMFMSMYDMLTNAKSVSFTAILHRDYLKTNSPLILPFNAKQIVFLMNFYKYCHNNHDSFQTTWSKWMAYNK